VQGTSHNTAVVSDTESESSSDEDPLPSCRITFVTNTGKIFHSVGVGRGADSDTEPESDTEDERVSTIVHH
jgi:hypothetical protein